MDWVQALQQALPASAVLTDPTARTAYGYDASYARGMPDAVVLPESTEQVAEVLRLAHSWRVPVYPRGGGTGLAGGSVPRGGIALVLRRMDRILAIDHLNLQARVQAGALVKDLQRAVQERGLFYPVDPGSAAVCTVGGNVATNAGGPRSFRYGSTRHYVLGLQVVLADGRIVELGGKTTKRVCGYDLHGLFVGSEGTLGVITEVTLRLLPPPAGCGTISAWFARTEEAAEAIPALAASQARPASVEFMDVASLGAAAAFLPDQVRIQGNALLLCELLGRPEAMKADAEELEGLLRSAGATKVAVAFDAEEQERLWSIRRAISPAVARFKPTKISEDATVPLAAIPRFLAELARIRDAFGVQLVVFGHAGDGNFHPNLLCDERDPREMARVEAAIEAIFAAALELGGTLSGEHGIGLLKAAFLPRAVDPHALELMRDLKKLLDPNGILNPGKLLQDGPTLVGP